MLELKVKPGLPRQARKKYLIIFPISGISPHLLPAERLNDMEITGDTLRFSTKGLGHSWFDNCRATVPFAS